MRLDATAAFVLRRLGMLVVLLVAVSFVVFGLLYLAPGSVEQVLLGTRQATPELIAAIRAEHHLDEPFLVQYWLWLRDAVQLDFGTSITSGQAVVSSLESRIGVTAFLGVYASVLAVVVGIPLGMLAALRRRTAVDRTVVGISVLGWSTPSFVLGVLLLYLFAVELGWFPTFGAGEGFLDRLWHLTLPAVAMATVVMALMVKLTRAAMIEVLDQDYVAFARALGTQRRTVVVRYVLRNALIPIVTAAGLVLTLVLTASVLVETTFALPGIGSLLVDAVGTKDLPVLQGIAMILATAIVIVTLLVDLVYMAVDPRIRMGRNAS